MGFTPAQVDAMGFWEFACCTAAHARAHGGEAGAREGEGMSEERARDLGIEGF